MPPGFSKPGCQQLGDHPKFWPGCGWVGVKIQKGVPVLSQNGPKTDITPTHHLTALTCYIHIACSFQHSCCKCHHPPSTINTFERSCWVRCMQHRLQSWMKMKTPMQCPQVSANLGANNWVTTPNFDHIIVGQSVLLEELSLSLESSCCRWWHFGHGLKLELLISCLYVTAWRLPANCQPHPVLHSDGEVAKLMVARWATFDKSLTTIQISKAGLSSRNWDMPCRSSLMFSRSLFILTISDLMFSLSTWRTCVQGDATATIEPAKLWEEWASIVADPPLEFGSRSLSAKPMSGDSAKYDRTAMLPHLPRSWIVTGSNPQADKVRAPVIRNVCPEIIHPPVQSFAEPPDLKTARRIVSTTPSLVQ